MSKSSWISKDIHKEKWNDNSNNNNKGNSHRIGQQWQERYMLKNETLSQLEPNIGWNCMQDVAHIVQPSFDTAQSHQSDRLSSFIASKGTERIKNKLKREEEKMKGGPKKSNAEMQCKNEMCTANVEYDFNEKNAKSQPSSIRIGARGDGKIENGIMEERYSNLRLINGSFPEGEKEKKELFLSIDLLQSAKLNCHTRNGHANGDLCTYEKDLRLTKTPMASFNGLINDADHQNVIDKKAYHQNCEEEVQIPDSKKAQLISTQTFSSNVIHMELDNVNNSTTEVVEKTIENITESLQMNFQASKKNQEKKEDNNEEKEKEKEKEKTIAEQQQSKSTSEIQHKNTIEEIANVLMNQLFSEGGIADNISEIHSSVEGHTYTSSISSMLDTDYGNRQQNMKTYDTSPNSLYAFPPEDYDQQQQQVPNNTSAVSSVTMAQTFKQSANVNTCSKYEQNIYGRNETPFLGKFHQNLNEVEIQTTLGYFEPEMGMTNNKLLPERQSPQTYYYQRLEQYRMYAQQCAIPPPTIEQEQYYRRHYGEVWEKAYYKRQVLKWQEFQQQQHQQQQKEAVRYGPRGPGPETTEDVRDLQYYQKYYMYYYNETVKKAAKCPNYLEFVQYYEQKLNYVNKKLKALERQNYNIMSNSTLSSTHSKLSTVESSFVHGFDAYNPKKVYEHFSNSQSRSFMHPLDEKSRSTLTNYQFQSSPGYMKDHTKSADNINICKKTVEMKSVHPPSIEVVTSPSSLQSNPRQGIVNECISQEPVAPIIPSPKIMTPEIGVETSALTIASEADRKPIEKDHNIKMEYKCTSPIDEGLADNVMDLDLASFGYNTVEKLLTGNNDQPDDSMVNGEENKVREINYHPKSNTKEINETIKTTTTDCLSNNGKDNMYYQEYSSKRKDSAQKGYPQNNDSSLPVWFYYGLECYRAKYNPSVEIGSNSFDGYWNKYLAIKQQQWNYYVHKTTPSTKIMDSAAPPRVQITPEEQVFFMCIELYRKHYKNMMLYQYKKLWYSQLACHGYPLYDSRRNLSSNLDSEKNVSSTIGVMPIPHKGSSTTLRQPEFFPTVDINSGARTTISSNMKMVYFPQDSTSLPFSKSELLGIRPHAPRHLGSISPVTDARDHSARSPNALAQKYTCAQLQQQVHSYPVPC